jgi:hypothetical protein
MRQTQEPIRSCRRTGSLPSFRHRRVLTLVVLTGAAVAVGLTASPGSARHAKLAPGPWCGGPLWRQMNFSDVDKHKVDTRPVGTSVADISQLKQPSQITKRRTTQFQRQVWHLDVVIDRYRIGSDGEIALVLFSIPTAQYMNAYLANPNCLTPGSRMREEMIAARQTLKSHCPRVTANWQLLGISVELEGVGFWNPSRSTKGALPNGAELRPITNLKIASGCGIP